METEVILNRRYIDGAGKIVKIIKSTTIRRLKDDREFRIFEGDNGIAYGVKGFKFVEENNFGEGTGVQFYEDLVFEIKD